MKKLILLIIAVLSLTTGKVANAAYFSGGEINYLCLGGTTYLISLVYYKDCEGVALQNTQNVSFSCSTNSNFNFTASLTKVPGTGQNISSNCSQSPTFCNGGSIYGVAEYVFQATVTLVPCSLWTISQGPACREPLTTVLGDNCGNGYITAKLNNLIVPCNSSPIMTNKPQIVIANNQEVVLDMGAIEPDNDSLVYSLFAPHKGGINTSVSYISPYSYTNFLSSSTGINLNPITGEISMKPNAILTTVYGIKIQEYRKINGVPVMVGEVVRDMRLDVQDFGSLNIPVLSGMDFSAGMNWNYNSADTTYFINNTNNNPISFKINGYDPDTGNSKKFTISWNNGIPAASFTVNNNGTDSAWALFSWIPQTNEPKATQCFSVKIVDQSCPYNLINYRTYCIKADCESFDEIISDTSICVNNNITFNPPVNFTNHHWSTGDTLPYLTLSGQLLGVGTHTFVYEGKKGNCLYSDTFSLEVLPCTGINESDAFNEVSVYPNPTKDGKFTIKSNLDISNVEITDYIGKIIYSIDSNNSTLNKTKISPDIEISGVYFIRLKTENQMIIKKLIVE